MGNNVPQNHKNQREINQIWRNAESKANQVLRWYFEERFKDISEFNSLNLSILRPFEWFENGRSVGTIGVKKVLKIITPLRLINKINPTLAIIFSMILTEIDHLDVNYFCNIQLC